MLNLFRCLLHLCLLLYRWWPEQFGQILMKNAISFMQMQLWILSTSWSCFHQRGVSINIFNVYVRTFVNNQLCCLVIVWKCHNIVFAKQKLLYEKKKTKRLFIYLNELLTLARSHFDYYEHLCQLCCRLIVLGGAPVL